MSPRVVFEVLTEGGWASDEVQQEYLAGMLISSRSASGNDDTGVYYTKLASGLTISQARMHHAIYSALANGGVEVDPGNTEDLGRAYIWVPLRAVAEVLGTSIEDAEDVAAHAVVTLRAQDLVEVLYLGGPETAPQQLGRISEPLMLVRPTTLGAALYLWAYGVPGFDTRRIFELAGVTLVDCTFSDSRVGPLVIGEPLY